MRSVGDAFEQRACVELERAGLALLARNYSTRYGELDLVMLDSQTIVFVEVRYRKYASHGDAAASITPSKQSRLIKAAQLWLTQNSRYARASCRFDVMTYDGPPDNPRASWIRAAFEAV